MRDKKVICKWETDGQLAVIYQLNDILLFYKKESDPHFKKGEMVSAERADETNPYKAIRYHKNNVPSDAFILPSFAWSRN